MHGARGYGSNACCCACRYGRCSVHFRELSSRGRRRGKGRRGRPRVGHEQQLGSLVKHFSRVLVALFKGQLRLDGHAGGRGRGGKGEGGKGRAEGEGFRPGSEDDACGDVGATRFSRNAAQGHWQSHRRRTARIEAGGGRRSASTSEAVAARRWPARGRRLEAAGRASAARATAALLNSAPRKGQDSTALAAADVGDASFRSSPSVSPPLFFPSSPGVGRATYTHTQKRAHGAPQCSIARVAERPTSTLVFFLVCPALSLSLTLCAREHRSRTLRPRARLDRSPSSLSRSLCVRACVS